MSNKNPTANTRFFLWLLVAVVVIGLDQASKLIADHQLVFQQALPITSFFNFTLVYNEGAAFSFLSDAGGWQRWFFSLLSFVISTILLVWLYRLKAEETLLACALSLVIGGAIGNLIDRLAYGHVIDFLDVYYANWHWPAFNLADSAISLGAALLIWHSFTAETSD